MQYKKANFTRLLGENKRLTAQFKTNSLMLLIQSDVMQAAKTRAKLLDCIQVFSNYFQKTLLLRSALNDDARYDLVVQAHLREEFGHNIALMHDRKDKEPIWDPILEACSCWFSWKMFTLDNAEKTLLVHLVLEASANIFFKQAHQVMARHKETNYFEIHAAADEYHEAMGLDLLKGLQSFEYEHLLEIQQQGWDMLNTACQRMAELTSSV